MSEHQARTSRIARSLRYLACVAILFGTGGPALAQSTAVLGVSGGGEERDALMQQLMHAAEANRRLQVIERSDLTSDQIIGFLGCPSLNEQCLSDLASVLETERILFADVIGSDVHLRYFDAASNANLVDEFYPYRTQDERNLLELRLAAAVSNRTVLRILSDRTDVEIFVDGVSQGGAPVVLLDIPEGMHELEARCETCSTLEREITVLAGRFYSEILTPSSAVASSEPSEPTEPGTGGSDILAPALVMGVGGAMLLTGAIFGVMTNSTQEDFDATQSRAEAEDLADTGETQAMLSTIFFITGGTAVATGILLLVLSGDDDAAESSDAVSFHPTPFVTPSGGGVAFDFTF